MSWRYNDGLLAQGILALNCLYAGLTRFVWSSKFRVPEVNLVMYFDNTD